MIWFTSDTHFCHKNILHLTETPFHSVQERDEAIIKRWNEVVGENDTVYVTDIYNEREDFMWEMFRVNLRTHESIDFWGE